MSLIPALGVGLATGAEMRMRSVGDLSTAAGSAPGFT
jgi:hypothetical protein